MCKQVDIYFFFFPLLCSCLLNLIVFWFEIFFFFSMVLGLAGNRVLLGMNHLWIIWSYPAWKWVCPIRSFIFAISTFLLIIFLLDLRLDLIQMRKRDEHMKLHFSACYLIFHFLPIWILLITKIHLNLPQMRGRWTYEIVARNSELIDWGKKLIIWWIFN